MISDKAAAYFQKMFDEMKDHEVLPPIPGKHYYGAMCKHKGSIHVCVLPAGKPLEVENLYWRDMAEGEPVFVIQP